MRCILRVCLFFSFGLSCLPVLSQNWGKDILTLFNKAQVHHNNLDFSMESAVYDSLLELNNGIAPDQCIYEYGFEAHNLAGNFESAMSYFIKYSKSSWLSSRKIDTLLHSYKYTTLRNNKMFLEIIEMKKRGKKKFEKVVDEINYRRLRDQFFRKHNGAILALIENDSLSRRIYGDLYAENDLRNAEWLEQIVAEHGWLGKGQVGDRANSTLWLILQHSPLPFQKRLLPFLETSVSQGESSPIDCAMLIDRMSFNSLTKQKYGTQIENILIDGKRVNVVYPISDPVLVNERRKSVGLEPLEEYVSFFKIEIEDFEHLGDDLLLEKIRKKRESTVR